MLSQLYLQKSGSGVIFCRDGIKIGLENKFYGKCFPAYHAAGGHFLRNRLIPLAETG